MGRSDAKDDRHTATSLPPHGSRSDLKKSPGSDTKSPGLGHGQTAADHSSSHGYSSDSESSDIIADSPCYGHEIQEESCEIHELTLHAVMALASDAAEPTSRGDSMSVMVTTSTKDDTTEVITITELPADSGGEANPSNEEAFAGENWRNHPEHVVESYAGQEEVNLVPPWQQQAEKIAYHHKMPGWTYHHPSPAWWVDHYPQAGWSYYDPFPIWSYYNPGLDQISYFYPSPHLCVHNPSQTWYYYDRAMGWIYCDNALAWKYMHPEPYELRGMGPEHPPDWTFYRYFECPIFSL
ncbi:hypothetical protein NEUTE1DRAFT_44410 [Neurospora tetrasperma FGSC 2508]|uniref:Uncharacterized protein n=1 Tax=Neurospora tetrasperma (strain FGSC 2508 / ATCC MYA-4615 / P0657) TaxID=510951 RepID=F8MNX4_NEUT8|nr:uncharacterized protein NEUTE1DRAFT_44410 [Neurospora tetrasperma FGSC 2508]EGO57039.1 hypothetical protein NEUTE1DRAFT_44410 [Neurospora tetrasperma FGSC 2508]EGZ70051.1 hypothetical protein NEUTE2DRAFT_130077 [Neurospora tetrasperma FGSC 2509]